MHIRQIIRYWLYGFCPGFAGSVPYFGTRIYFPKGAVLFRRVCEEGIFEAKNLHVLQKLVRPGSYFFDVGANIGLMSAPILRTVPNVSIASFEPSPNTVSSLRRTIEQSSFGDRWKLFAKAVGMERGQATFSLAEPRYGAFDGLKSTQRVKETRQVTVEVTTIDHEWEQLGCPSVSMIKIDVEGGELAVLQGAVTLMECCCPFILLEWTKANLKHYGIAPRALYDFALAHRYRLFALPHVVPVSSAEELELQLLQTDSFLLNPAEVTTVNLWRQVWQAP